MLQVTKDGVWGDPGTSHPHFGVPGCIVMSVDGPWCIVIYVKKAGKSSI